MIMYFDKVGFRSAPVVGPAVSAAAVGAVGLVTAWVACPSPVVASCLASAQYLSSHQGMHLGGLQTPDLVAPLWRALKKTAFVKLVKTEKCRWRFSGLWTPGWQLAVGLESSAPKGQNNHPGKRQPENRTRDINDVFLYSKDHIN